MQLGWIDFSNDDKKNALNMLAMLRESGAVDELGLGIVRDAFANKFFPGTSTIQTRAKYFIILNNILDDFSYQNITKSNIDKLVKDFRIEEFECAKALAKNCSENGNREKGIIGGEDEFIKPNKEEKWIKRTPSMIYWNGLKTYKILGNDKENITSVKNYLIKSLSKKETVSNSGKSLGRISNKNDDDESESDNCSIIMDPIHSPCIYGKESNWIEKLTLRLTKKESKFLKSKIIQSVPESLLGLVLLDNYPIDTYLTYKRNDDTPTDSDFVKNFPHVFETFTQLLLSSEVKISKELKELLFLAVKFNKLATLTRIRYNIILSDYTNEHYENYWNMYSSYADDLPITLVDEIFEKLLIKRTGTDKFLKGFLNAYINKDVDTMDKYVISQEKRLKQPPRAKLIHKDQYYDSDAPVWLGGKELDFRLGITTDIVNDIYNC